MSIACFILAGKLNDALTVALDKLHDINLAMLICRLQDGENGEYTYGLLNKMFIEEGKMNDDPFLVNMGLWWKQQYFDSINSIGSMVDEVNAKMRS